MPRMSCNWLKVELKSDWIQFVGVRGMPERDIESLGVMGWGLDAARRFFRRRRRRP